jgi:hypothetical protein
MRVASKQQRGAIAAPLAHGQRTHFAHFPRALVCMCMCVCACVRSLRTQYGDTAIAVAAKIPGPGAHSPRFAAIESFGTTFSRSAFEKNQKFDRDRLFGRAGGMLFVPSLYHPILLLPYHCPHLACVRACVRVASSVCACGI